MKILSHCGSCDAGADPKILMGDALEAQCGHCGCIVTRIRFWKNGPDGIAKGEDAFKCEPPGTPSEKAPTQAEGRA